MNVYIDFENFKSLINSKEDPHHDLAISIFRKQLNRLFNFDKRRISQESKMVAWAQANLLQGSGKTTNQYNFDPFSNRPITGKSYKELTNSKSCGIYLLDDSGIENLKKSNSVVVGGVNEEVDKLISMLIFDDNSETHEFHIQKVISEKEFSSWEKLQSYKSPFSTILFIDRYMFKGPEVGGNLGLFENNIGQILKVFYEEHNSLTRLIFVYQINKHQVEIGQRDYDAGPDIEKLVKQIKKTIKNVSKNCPAPEIIFVGMPKGHIKADHDRNIISNYIRIKTGGGVMIFDTKGNNVSGSNDFDIYSLSRTNYSNACKELKDKISALIIETVDQFGDSCSLDGVSKFDIVNF